MLALEQNYPNPFNPNIDVSPLFMPTFAAFSPAASTCCHIFNKLS